jgi:energy-coupling factor transporter ATP-binding protein EcfA2
MDFYKIKTRVKKKGLIEVYPDFLVKRSEDLMVRAKSFYAIWDEERGFWSTNEYDVQRLVDKELLAFASDLKSYCEETVTVALMSDFSSYSWKEFRKYLSNVSDNSHQLDSKLLFSDSVVKKKDYASKTLPYPLKSGPRPAYTTLMNVLYDKDNLQKLEWAIGAIVSGDSKDIQKFLVLYGDAGTGKSTVLNIIQKLFNGYYTTFEAKALTSSSNAFSTEVFKGNPLVAIQHDGDLSRIEDNTKLNSIVSHEEMTMNEKYKPSYTARLNCFLFMGTNKPVKITDSKSGVIRRLIDVRPSGNKVAPDEYTRLYSQIDFELGAIAAHCLSVYSKLGKHRYDRYRPVDMMYKTNVFFNFVEDSYPVFKENDSTTLRAAYAMYKEYCNEGGSDFVMPMYKFREELKNYFREFSQRARIDDQIIRSYYSGFLAEKILNKSDTDYDIAYSDASYLVLGEYDSIFNKECCDYPAQYARDTNGAPMSRWNRVTTKLKDIDTSKLHYVQVPENHIVIDFDLKDHRGCKSLEANSEAAAKWPETYAEVSKSGNGIHLHYIYDGDPNKLSRIYDDCIEVKVYTGNSSLRRKLTKCNTKPIAHISSGLPLKGDDKVVSFEAVKNEKALRTIIKKNLNKEYHGATAPSVNFIFKVLEDYYKSGKKYDVTDLRPAILVFANNSTHQSEKCIKLVTKMHFKSDEPTEVGDAYSSEELAFFDVEVYPNLFLVVWKYEGEDHKPVVMINPTSTDIESLIKLKLIGFNCRRYDNHILYARMMGYTNEQLFNLSQMIIENSRNAMFGEAYNLSYTDVYDFSSVKQSLKKFEIELGIHHQEMGIPWDQPVDESLWEKVGEYCINDVIATEAVFHARKADWVARQILADLSGLSVNDTTQQHTARIIFGTDRNPQDKFVYTDLSEMFPGYVFRNGKSTYKGEETGEGGYVYAEPGIYTNVALLDIASMHPTSIINLNLFGPYTKNFADIREARIAVKHGDFEKLKTLLDGKLFKYVEHADFNASDLAYSLKIAINIVYGLTSAKFANKFKDPRNVDNIVAKRGALFMIDLKEEVQKRGFTVAHIKTDSIKIPNATSEIIDFVMKFGEQYGYSFEHEATYERMCLANNAVYIARYLEEGKPGRWTATGAQFQHPYVFKKLFSREDILFEDLCETKSVTTALYLDLNEGLKEDEHNYQFVGKVGSFCPIKPGCGGGLLLREKNGKYDAASGTKGYRWLEAEVVKDIHKESDIDRSYANKLVDDAIETINKFGDAESFISDDEYIEVPW